MRRQIEIKNELIAAKDAQIAAMNGFIEIQRAQVKEWSTAALERKEAIKFDDAAMRLQEQEILRVRGERDQARAANKWWGLGGILIGVALDRAFTQRR